MNEPEKRKYDVGYWCCWTFVAMWTMWTVMVA